MANYRWSKKFRDPRSEEPKELFTAFKEMRHGIEQELEEIQKAFNRIKPSTTAIVISSGGSGGGVIVPPGKQALYVPYTVSGAGIVTVPFTPVGTTSYGVNCFVLDSGGDQSLAIPQIPPISSDSRTTSSVDIRVFNSGVLQLFITLS